MNLEVNGFHSMKPFGGKSRWRQTIRWYGRQKDYSDKPADDSHKLSWTIFLIETIPIVAGFRQSEIKTKQWLTEECSCKFSDRMTCDWWEFHWDDFSSKTQMTMNSKNAIQILNFSRWIQRMKLIERSQPTGLSYQLELIIFISKELSTLGKWTLQ